MANGESQDSAEFKTSLFGFKLAGRDAVTTFLFIAILALAGLTFWEHSIRNKEHSDIVCMIKLNLYVYSSPRGEPLDWSKMPVDLYSCVPRFLYENVRVPR